MKTLLGMLAWIAVAVILGCVLPYFRPAAAWPDWLILVVGLAFVAVCTVFWPRHRSAKQILDECQRLQWEEEDKAAVLERAKKEGWRADVVVRMESELRQLRGRIHALRDDSSR